jgi:hypothetical protein
MCLEDSNIMAQYWMVGENMSELNLRLSPTIAHLVSERNHTAIFN